MTTTDGQSVGFLRALGEMLGIVVLRFPFPLNVFSVVLMTANTASLAFINTIYGQVAFAAMLSGIPVIGVIYMRQGFVRLLGLGHVLWLPMLIWFALNMPDQAAQPALYWWIICLFVCNGTSLLIDVTDLTRYLVFGQREPHYHWKKPNAESAA